MLSTLRDQTKIGFLGPAPPFRGGISRFALELAKTYQEQGAQVQMFTFIRQYPVLLFPGKSQTSDFQDTSLLPTQRILIPYLPHTWNNALRCIQKWQPEILVISYSLPFFAPAYAWIGNRLKGIRIIYLAHNIEFHEAWPGANLLTRLAFQPSERIVVLSESCLKALHRRMPASIASKGVKGFHPIYDCFRQTKPDSVPKPDLTPTVLFFGLIKPYKGLDVLIKAMKQVRKRLPVIRLLIAGEVYQGDKYYQSLIRQLKLQDIIETHFRFIPDQEVEAFFRRSQVCVLPYKTATQSGIIAMAYSFDLPLIASDVGGLSEYIESGKTGLLVPPNDPEALAAAIIRYFESGLHSAMSKTIPEYRKRFSWDKLAEIVLLNQPTTDDQ